MNHLIFCPKCSKGMLFNYGETTKKCVYEGCDGGEFPIVYTPELYDRIIKDFQTEEKRLKEKQARYQPRGFVQPKLQKTEGGWICVQQ